MDSEKKSVYNKKIITLNENLGGAGGFYEGEKYALQLQNIDWIMISDDDAYPMPDYLLGLKESISNIANDDVALICGRVEENHNCVNMHRAILKTKWKWNFREEISLQAYNNPCIEIDFASYVGILVRKSVLDKVVLVNKDYFIWNDDTEHCYRIKKIGRMICFPKYCVIHDAENENNSLSWKTYYGIRNNTFFIKNNFPFQSIFVISIFFIKSLLSPLKGNSIVFSKVRLTALIDGLFGRLGKHNIYKPGWKQKKY